MDRKYIYRRICYLDITDTEARCAAAWSEWDKYRLCNSGNVRINRKSLKNRKRKQLGDWLFLIVFITLLAMLVSSIKNMKAEMEEMQTILKRIEVLQYENVETTAQMEEETDRLSPIHLACHAQ